MDLGPSEVLSPPGRTVSLAMLLQHHFAALTVNPSGVDGKVWLQARKLDEPRLLTCSSGWCCDHEDDPGSAEQEVGP